MPEESEHQFDPNNVDMAWIDAHGFYHVRCSCGQGFVNRDASAVTHDWVRHVDEEAGKTSPNLETGLVSFEEPNEV